MHEEKRDTDFYGTWDGRDLHLVFNHIGIDAFKAPPTITRDDINRELPAAIERTRIYEALGNLRRVKPGKTIEGSLPVIETKATTAAGIADAIAETVWEKLNWLLGEGSAFWSESSTDYDDSHWYLEEPFNIAVTSHADDSAIRREHGFSYRDKDGKRYTGDGSLEELTFVYYDKDFNRYVGEEALRRYREDKAASGHYPETEEKEREDLNPLSLKNQRSEKAWKLRNASQSMGDLLTLAGREYNMPHYAELADFALGVIEGLWEIGAGTLKLILTLLNGILYEFFGSLVADKSWNDQFRALINQLVNLPGDALTGKISDAIQKDLNKALRDLDRASTPREQGKALVKLAEVLLNLFDPEFTAKYLREPRIYGYQPKPGQWPLTKAGLDFLGLKVKDVMTADQIDILMKYEPKGQWISPHARDVPVLLTETMQDVRLIRVGKKGASNKYGNYYVQPFDIKGMTPKQIQKYLNLDFVPDVFQDVTIPNGQELLVSRVGKQPFLGMNSDAGRQFTIKLPDDIKIESKEEWFGEWVYIQGRL